MSFSYEQKLSIINHNYKSACCRRALLTGILKAKGTALGERISLRVEKLEVAEFIARLIKEQYGADATVEHPKKGGRCVEISFESRAAARLLSDYDSSGRMFSERCAGCQSAFLRGVFLAAGRVTDPSVQHSMEFTLGTLAEPFAEYLTELGFSPKISNKKIGKTVYFKNSTSIEDFYAICGMNPAMFAVIEAKFSAEARKNIMRLTNCETNNIKKAVDAAAKQKALIERLEEKGLLSLLPDEIANTARLRMQYPDLSLSQLAAVSVPSITKSGLSHRLSKVMELGERLLEEQDTKTVDSARAIDKPR